MSTRAWRSPQMGSLLFVAPLMLVFAWTMGAIVASNDVLIVRASVYLSAITVISMMLFWMMARSDSHGRPLLVFLMISLMLKLTAMAFRFNVGLLADAWQYDDAGVRLAGILASGRWPEEISYGGSDVVRLLTGLVYFVTGETIYGISMLWAWFGLLGMLFFYKAFSTAFPGGNRRLYMALVFLYPSMLLWTSSLGKDALMVMALGMASYGLARLQQRTELVGVWWLGLGTFGMLMIRPHIAAIFAIAAGFSALIRPIRAGLMTPVIRMAGLILFVAVGAFVVQTAAGYIQLEGLAPEDVLGFIETEQGLSEQGGSAFQQVSVRNNPLAYLVNVPTILFRPFPWEALRANRSTFALIASLEGFGLLLLMLYRRRSVAAALAASPRNSFVLFTVIFAALFIFIFSAIANFGILARQRSTLLPLVFMWIAYLGSTPTFGHIMSGQAAHRR